MFEYITPAVGPVIQGLESYEVVYAKDQPEYTALRTLVGDSIERPVMSRWTFTAEQRAAIAAGADLYISVLTFGAHLQPFSIMVVGNEDYRRELAERVGLERLIS